MQHFSPLVYIIHQPIDSLFYLQCLVLAYVFLLLNAFLGGPMWPDLFVSNGALSLDAVVWAVLSLWVHGTSLVHLWRDERDVVLNEHLESLWRLFYRTGGLSKQVFQQRIAPYVSVVEYKQGTDINIADYFYIIYQGTVELHSSTVGRRRDVDITATIGSGQMFDYRLLGLLHEDDDHVKDTVLQKAMVTSRSVTLFQFARHEMVDMIQSEKTVWLQLVTQVLGRMSSKLFSNPDAESQLFLLDYLHQYFTPLREWELPPPAQAGSGQAASQPWQHLVYTMQHSFSPPWPIQNHWVGLRHRLAPPAKVLDEIPGKVLDTQGTGLETLYLNRWRRTDTLSTSASEDNQSNRWGPTDTLSTSASEDNHLFLTASQDDDHDITTLGHATQWTASRNLYAGYGSTADNIIELAKND